MCASPPSLAVRSMTDGLGQADAFELDARLRRTIRLEQRIEAEMPPLLRRVADARVHRLAGHSSFAAFARERLGISERKARGLVRLARAGAACPELAAAFGDGRLSWVQAQVLLPVLLARESAPFRPAWVAWAGRVSVRRLEAEVDAALERLAREPEGFEGSDGAPERQTCAEPRAAETPSSAGPRLAETARFFFLAPRDVARLFQAVVCSVRRALEQRLDRPVSPGEAVEWMFDHAFQSSGANDRRVRREHVVFRSAGGSDELANRTTLCAFHHLRGVHAGRVRGRGAAPHRLRFELGIREGRQPLLRYGPGEAVHSSCA